MKTIDIKEYKIKLIEGKLIEVVSLSDSYEKNSKKEKLESNSIKVVSLFSGCGGLDLGFANAGFNVIWANDINKKLIPTYNYNHPSTEFIAKSITDIPSSEIPDCDVIIGGPPCQSWSIAGSLRGIDDERGMLFLEYIRIINDKKPKVFVAENVKGIISSRHKETFNNFIKSFEEIGYNVQYKLLNAKNYGVPQDRERVIIVGVREDINNNYSFPKPTHIERFVSLRDAIGDLVNNPGEYMEGSFSSMYMSRNRRRGWNEVGFTVQASGRQAQLHPDSPEMVKVDKDKMEFRGSGLVRRMSVRESARIQTFPDDFEFIADRIDEKYKMIGNAVPVKLAEAIANEIRKILK